MTRTVERDAPQVRTGGRSGGLRRLAWRAAVGVAGLASASAFAASMHVAPLRLDLNPQRPVSSLTIGNAEQSEIPVQIEAVAWTQEDGRDVYTPTRDVLVNPSIFRIPAGGQQIVRAGLQVGADKVERSYRIFVRQLPQDRSTGQGLGLQTLLRIGLPVFVAPAEVVESLDWTLRNGVGNRLELVLDNRGTAHIQITNITVRRDNGDEVLRKEISQYVLAGKSAPLPIELPAPAALGASKTLRVEAVAAGGRALPPIVVRLPDAPAAAR